MATDYAELLKRGREQIKEEITDQARFEMPKVRGHIQGNRTVITNWYQIATNLNRDVHQLTKYVLRELATPGELGNKALLLGTKLSATRVNKKLEQYVKEKVMCNQCNRPDTKIMIENNVTSLKCLACGAKATIRA